MKPQHFWLTLLPFLPAMSSCTTAGSSGRNSAGVGSSKLTVITPHWEGIRKEYEAGFTAWLKASSDRPQNVSIEWLAGQGSPDILRIIDSDFKGKGKTDIDVAFGGGLENFLILKQKGYLAKAEIKASEQIPEAVQGIPIKDADRQWYGAALSAFGIMYNKKVLDLEGLPIPKAWADLSRPEYRGRVAATDPRQSGSFMMMCEIILQSNGWDQGWSILTGMIANARGIGNSASQIPRDVAIGEAALGPAIDFYARQEISQAGAGSATLGYIIPVAETVVTPDPIAILRGAPNESAALAFVEYVLTDGQKLLAFPKGHPNGPKDFMLGRLPMTPSLYDEADVRKVLGETSPFKLKAGFRYDEKKGSARRRILSDLIGTLLIDNRTALQSAWKKIRPGSRWADLAKPPVTEDQMLVLAAKWDDATHRNDTIGKWARFARAKYGQ